jgi:hypothetical protein
MKKLILIFIWLSASSLWSQQDTMIFSNEIEAGNHIFEQLDPQYYDYALLNRSTSTLPILYEQIAGNYDQIMTTEDWLLIYSDLALSCYDTTLMPTITQMAQQIYDFFFFHDYNYTDLIQPFGLILQNVSMIDTVHLSNGNLTIIDGQIIPNVPENTLYTKTVIKSATIMEFYPDNGYAIGNLKYDPDFIITSDDVTILNVKIDIGDGSGFQDFGPTNTSISYDRSRDSTVAQALISYELNDSVHQDTIQFYLTTSSNQSSNRSSESWDYTEVVDPIPGNDLKYEIGIKYGCGNGTQIRRPIIISCAYRPAIQPFSMDKYWEQFNIGGLFESYVALGYDVIFIKDKPGNRSLEVAGDELAEFIKSVNNAKKLFYPYEDWETVVMGYSMGGQKARYALLKLEKEHMDNGGPHHHTKLYIPFDSPHHSANIPLFTQATYKTFHNTNLVAAIAHNSFVDEASRDMGLYSIYSSSLISLPSVVGTFDMIPHPDPDEVSYQNALSNNFNHLYTHLGDTRGTFPSFPRNIGVSMGSYKDDYEDVDGWGMSPGMLLFSQHAPGYFYVPFLGFHHGFVNRKLFASKYSNSSPQPCFSRKDLYFVLGVFPYYVQTVYNFQEHEEWDMAQGGYKTLFYSGLAGGATTILRSSAYGLGNQQYDKEMSFMPLVSALAINPTEWGNGQLYYNLQDEGLMYQIYDYNPVTDKSEIYGYPHLGHPTNHFTITPFEAVYADDFNWDHIVMSNTLDNYLNGEQSYYNNLRDFLNDEVEGWVVALQNKVIGQNHVQNPSYEYKAWYKSRYQIFIGNKVTSKTDPGDYIIESSGNITVYAGVEIVIQDGFHAKPGSTFHAFIQDASDCYVPSGKSASSTGVSADQLEKQQLSEEATDLNQSADIKLIPNPNTGAFVFSIDEANSNGQMYVYGVDGKLYHQQTINQSQTALDLTLVKGMYLVVFITAEKRETVKLIIN